MCIINFLAFFINFQEKGECYTCGSNSFGQLGFPTGASDSRPCLVKSLEGKIITDIACGDTFTVAVTAGSFFHDQFQISQTNYLTLTAYGKKIWFVLFQSAFTIAILSLVQQLCFVVGII